MEIIIGVFAVWTIVSVLIGLEIYRAKMRRRGETRKPSGQATRGEVIERSILWQMGLNFLGFAVFFLLFWPWGGTELDRIIWFVFLIIGLPVALVSTGLNVLLLWGGIRVIESRAKRAQV